MDYVLSILIPAAVSILVTGGTLYLNRYWQVRQEVRAEGLKHYRALKTYGFLTLASLAGDTQWLEDADQLARVRKALDEVGEAIFELDLIASPTVLARLVTLLREFNALTTNLETLAQTGGKLTSAEIEHARGTVRGLIVELFYAMRADVGRSNRGLKREDVLYLLTVNSSDSRKSGQPGPLIPTQQ